MIGDGHLRPEYEKTIEDYQLTETVKFLGNRKDDDIFYAGLDIVALTSFNEGTPLSLIEAMANGKPVISTDVGGVPDILGETSRETGRVYFTRPRSGSCFGKCGRNVQRL